MMDSEAKLAVLQDKWTGCTKCGLSKTRESKRIIFGMGPSDAEYVVVLDAPSEEDVVFGKLLNDEGGTLVYELLHKAGADPENNVFFTTTVGCRPFAVIPATDDTQERTQDREPTKAEVEPCRPRVQEIIYLVDPRIVITMGKVSWMSLVKHRGKHKTINTAAGELFDIWIPGRLRNVRYPALATFSPKTLLANPSVAPHAPITTTLEALTRVVHYVTVLKQEESR